MQMSVMEDMVVKLAEGIKNNRWCLCKDLDAKINFSGALRLTKDSFSMFQNCISV